MKCSIRRAKSRVSPWGIKNPFRQVPPMDSHYAGSAIHTDRIGRPTVLEPALVLRRGDSRVDEVPEDTDDPIWGIGGNGIYSGLRRTSERTYVLFPKQAVQMQMRLDEPPVGSALSGDLCRRTDHKTCLVGDSGSRRGEYFASGGIVHIVPGCRGWLGRKIVDRCPPSQRIGGDRAVVPIERNPVP